MTINTPANEIMANTNVPASDITTNMDTPANHMTMHTNTPEDGHENVVEEKSLEISFGKKLFGTVITLISEATVVRCLFFY